MRRVLCSPVVVALLACSSLGASCNDNNADGEVVEAVGNATGGSDDEEQIDDLPQVDVSDLTRSERRMWVDVVNEVLSPCGEPVSVAGCIDEERNCRSCVPAARYLVRLVTEGYDQAEIEEHYNLRYGRDTEVEIDVADAPVRGARMAPVTIVEFSDFECPYCGEAHPVLERVLREYEGQVRMVFLHYPLPGHDHAMPAARAAVAAANQDKFWEMHDLLFENQRALEPEDLEEYAEQIGLDMDRFRGDLTAEATQRRVEADRAKGREVEVSGTPTIFINGRRFREPPRALPAYIREELDQR